MAIRAQRYGMVNLKGPTYSSDEHVHNFDTIYYN